MAREGTRSATGNSRPRIFPTATTTTTTTTTKKRTAANTGVKRKAPAKKTTTTTTKGAKPVGVTKKRAAPKKKTSIGTKAKGVVKKVEGAITNNPAKKAAGTKKIRGTDGNGGKAAAKSRTTVVKK